ncbi:MAG: SsrA-binding protein [Parcubacteria group bacterium GW2011_GWD2_42_14]|nr:MAG: SsrA-binding protein [Parcubacteria group bacterium GW2011_GWD2_42_14]
MLKAMPVLIKNKKAKFDFEILETFEAGIELLGSEVKSLRNGRGKLEGAHVIIRGGEAYLVGASVDPYQPKNISKDYDAERPRRLLLTRKELNKLIGLEASRGLTLIPVSLYTNKNLLKLNFALVRGKKKADKRESIKERDTKRDLERLIKYK